LEKATVIENLMKAAIEGKKEEVRKNAEEVVARGIDPLEAVNEGLLKGVDEVSRKFDIGEYFLPHLIVCGEAARAGLDILEPEISKQMKESKPRGRVVLGTVEGDIHDIGKTIVGTMLNIHGFDVIDLGSDVPDDVFIEKVKELKPAIVGMSALITTTRQKQKDVIDKLSKAGLRGKVRVMVGGGAVTPEWTEKIAADAYGEDAMDTLKKARRLIGLE